MVDGKMTNNNTKRVAVIDRVRTIDNRLNLSKF
jgi:hypothetical protein